MTTIYPVIMCGGAGTRLWPLSVRTKPKQFHALVSERTMLQETIARLQSVDGNLIDISPPSFVCAVAHEKEIRNQCRDLGVEPFTLILEPCPRNTAAVGAAISHYMREIDPDGLVLLLPADHHVDEPSAFWEAVANGLPSANDGYLTTFGIMPTRPETGFGYIQAGESLGGQCVKVEAFKEKPEIQTAERYIETGNYYWNGGIFLFSPASMISEFEAQAPDILTDAKKAISEGRRSEDAIYLDPQAFAKCRSESIDYAIMETARKVAMVCPVEMGWSDIGSWDAVRDYWIDGKGGCKDIGNVTSSDCHNSLIYSNGPFVAALGLKDIIVVATESSILITHSDSAQDVKNVVTMLKETHQAEKL